MVKTIEGYLKTHPGAQELCKAVQEFIESLGQVESETTKTQISFGTGRKFAWVWLPQLWGVSAPENGIVVSFRLGHQLKNPKIKESLEPRPGWWMHHVELESKEELDSDLRGWLQQAYHQSSV